MESFIVNCETCQAKLRVRDANAVGQIHACPKCESMVMIVPPSLLKNSSLLGNAEQSADAEGLGAEPSAIASTPASKFKSPPAEFLPPDLTAELAPPEPTPPAPEEVEAESAPAELPSSTAGLFSNKRLGLGFAIGGVGMLLIGGLVSFLMFRPDEVAELAPPENIAALDEPAINEEVAEEPAPLAPSSSEVLEPAPPVEVEAVALPEKLPDEAPALPAVLPLPSANESLPKIPPIETEINEPKVAAIPKPIDLWEIDLSTLDQASLKNLQQNGATVAKVKVDAPTPKIQLEPAEQPQPLSKPGQLLRGPTNAVLLTEQEINHQLGREIASARWANARLVDWLHAMSMLTNVPVSVSPAVWELGIITPDHAVTINEKNTTPKQLFEQALGKLRLRYEIRNGCIQVVPDRFASQREMIYPIGDITLAGPSPQELAELLKQVVAPTSWQKDAKLTVAGESFRITQSTAVQIRISRWLDRLRLVRGLPTVTKFPKSKLPTEPRFTSLNKSLTAPATFTFSAWTPLGEAIEYWQAESKLNIVVDWPALADLHLTPNSSIAYSAIDKPWRECFTGMLDPLGLEWLPINRDTVLISSKDHAKQIVWTEFYPAGQPLPQHSADQQSTIDKPSGAIILRGNVEQHREMANSSDQ